MPKIEIEKDISEAFEAKLKASGYNSKAEWLGESRLEISLQNSLHLQMLAFLPSSHI